MFVVRSVCADDDVSLLLWLQLLVVWPLQLSTDLLCSVAQVTGKVTLLCTHIHMKQVPLPLFASLLDHCPPLPSKSHFFSSSISLSISLPPSLSLSLFLFFLHLILSAPSCGEADKELIYHPIKCRHWNIASKKKKKKKKKKACRFHPALIGLPLACAPC